MPGEAQDLLQRCDFAALAGWSDDDHAAAYRAFRQLACAGRAGIQALRRAAPPPAGLARAFEAAARGRQDCSAADARRFFESAFVPHRILAAPDAAPGRRGFLTGYYEPVVEGALHRSTAFSAPILARPEGLPRLGPGTAREAHAPRAAIEAEAEAGGGCPIVWLRDWTEVFFVHVQGSARVKLGDGTALRLVYDGRNGHAYTSIGRELVREGKLGASDLSLDRVKDWVRAQGQAVGQPGRALLQRNLSYIFFRAEPAPADEGPIGGAGVPLTPLRSIAIDRGLWAYGLPVWIEAALPWRRPVIDDFRQLTIAEDTGSAILGAARADLFFGSGEAAGRRAGIIRHAADFAVLLPRPAARAG